MTHQTQLEKAKYRNWVKGGLSMKYLKDGLAKFADDVVRHDHTRILQQIRHTTGLICTTCTLRDLKPVHKYVLDSTTNRKCCPRGQSNCNCLYPNKSSCPNKICDAIYEEILNFHASSPPAPCWKNTDITKWVTQPWEVAKCFINAPGYRDKHSAEEIDVAGLLHVFINNTMYQTSLTCLISGSKSDAFCKALDLRNKIFHSPYMELEDQDLNECLRYVVDILKDEKKLKDTQCAKEAVDNIKQLQNQEFIITTETEASVLREIVEQKINKLNVSNAELAKEQLELQEKHLELQKGYSALRDKHSELEKGHSQLEEKHVKIEKGHSELEEKHSELEKGHSQLEEKHLKLEKGHSQLEDKHSELEKGHSKLEEKHVKLEKGHSALEEKHSELNKRHYGLDKKHSVLSKDISELKKTHLKLEKEHSDINQRLYSVEKDVENLKSLHQKQLISVEKRLDAQKKLVEHLQRHYVKTSVSPLKTRENAIDIGNVYVEPQIETEKKDEQNKKTHRFLDVVQKSVKNDLTKNAKEDNGNVETMKQFDFLFYLPLRRLQKGGRIREMILWYYKDEIPGEILEDILLNVPEKCLILADGLDEWTPNYDKQRPQHLTTGLPYSEDIKDVTLLMTSRPSAPGVLNMTFTEIDLKITMCGIPAKSIDSMTEKYLLSLSKESNKDMVLKKLKDQKIDHIEKTPLLLQQLIWMIAHDIDVGECLSDYYSSLVNIALKWTEEKVGQKKLKTVSSSHIPAELCLPSRLMEYDAYWWNRNLLFILGKIAFDLLINSESQMSFGRAKLNRDGLDDDVIDMMLTTGLLTEDNCHDNTKQKTQLAFTHASFQEYFAALYIESQSRIKQTQVTDDPKELGSSDARRQPHNENNLESLFRRFSSVQDFLQFGVVLQMLCGRNPDILLDVCEQIYRTAQRDIEYSMLRDQFLMETSVLHINEYSYKTPSSYTAGYVNTTLQMQKFIKSCISHCKRKGDTNGYKIPVLDLILGNHRNNEYSALLQYVNPQTVLHSSVISDGFTDTDVDQVRSDLYQNYVVECNNLQTIAIDSYSMNLSETFLTAVSKHISKSISIRKIKFKTSEYIVGFPVISLHGHQQIQLINVCGGINIINVDTTNLEVIEHAGSSNDNFIKKRPGRGSYNYNYLDVILSRVEVIPKLRHLELSGILPRPAMGGLISSNVTLNVLRLRNCVSYFIRSGLGCVIDLSTHNDLQFLETLDNKHVYIKSVNTKNLITVITDSHDVLHAVRNASKLTSLTFGRYGTQIFACFEFFTKQMNEDMCSCSQLQKIELKDVKIEHEALEMNCGIRNLNRITLNNVEMSQTTWIRFASSLLNLNQSVTVKAKLYSQYLSKDYQIFRRYLSDNEKKFKLIRDINYYTFKFETVPLQKSLDYNTMTSK